MKSLITTLLFVQVTLYADALVINEVMSNPNGDDGGREWIEVYNNGDSSIDLSGLTISIKGGAFITATPVSGGTTLGSHGYAIVGSMVSGATKFSQDYPNYIGPLFKSSISLVNTGVTSIEIKLQGVSADILSSYTAAKEGSTYSLINGSFTTGAPTPGEDNKVPVVVDDTTTTTSSSPQYTIPQATPSVADIVFYLPKEKTVIAGAPSLFSVVSTNHEGVPINNISYTWSFGDGGGKTGATTTYRYYYPGRYVATVEGTNGIITGTGRMNVIVVAPDISMSPIIFGKYGPYIDITNPNSYDLDISGWKISIDGACFPFPKNTILASGVTHFNGLAMDFASTTISSSTIIKLLFPTMEEALRVSQWRESESAPSALQDLPQVISTTKKSETVIVGPRQLSRFVKQTKASIISSSTKATSSGVLINVSSHKDTRLASFLKSILGKH